MHAKMKLFHCCTLLALSIGLCRQSVPNDLVAAYQSALQSDLSASQPCAPPRTRPAKADMSDLCVSQYGVIAPPRMISAVAARDAHFESASHSFRLRRTPPSSRDSGVLGMLLGRDRFNFNRNTGVEHHAGHGIDILDAGQAIDIGDFVPVRD